MWRCPPAETSSRKGSQRVPWPTGRSADEALDIVSAEPDRLVVLARGFELGEYVLDTDRTAVGIDVDVGAGDGV